MNSLSWLLYAIDVVGNVKALAMTLIVVVGLLWVGLNIAVLVSEGEVLEWKDYKKWWVRGAAILLASTFAFCFFPSRNTLYAIAASQAGEQIAHNETVKDITSDAAKALQQWIKRQIESEAQK